MRRVTHTCRCVWMTVWRLLPALGKPRAPCSFSRSLREQPVTYHSGTQQHPTTSDSTRRLGVAVMPPGFKRVSPHSQTSTSNRHVQALKTTPPAQRRTRKAASPNSLSAAAIMQQQRPQRIHASLLLCVLLAGCVTADARTGENRLLRSPPAVTSQNRCLGSSTPW